MADDPKKVAPRTLFESNREQAYRKYLRVAKKLLKLVKTLSGSCTSISQLRDELTKLAHSPAFTEFCTEQARQIVTMLAVGQKKSWRAAASASSNGKKIYKALMREFKETRIGDDIDAIIEHNAKLIKTVPQDVAEQLSKLAAKREFEGVRPEEITEEILKKAPNLTEAQAKRIARTESAKAASALVQARAESLGLDFYIWKTCSDERVRDSHKRMEGVVCRWDDPPSPEELSGEKSAGNYHPAGIYNCRCVPLTVVDEKDLSFPCEVYTGGKIVKVNNLRDFKEMFGLTGGGDDELYENKYL